MSRPASPRMRKVNEALREVIAEEIAGLKDPRIAFVTVTEVSCAPDLRTARVYYSVMGSGAEARATAAALASAGRKIQGAVARRVRLKYTPVLHFAVDPSIEQGVRISEILRQIEGGDEDP